ncbi:MAG TPA: TonB family protein [Candidatus Acidoferrum sp.]|jgi:TonB family protein|nr:TonB family protein [Candidatus Acidoferrum sp.]
MSEAWKTWEGQAVDGVPLRQYLGGSDHSAVYLTQLNSSGEQKAAIKFIPADTSAHAQLAKWRVAGELTHPHLLPLIRVGRCELANTNFLYVVMEYAEENLSEILPQRALEPDEVRQVLESAVEALTYLHAQGLAHTRIKPGNILAAGDQLKLSSDTLSEIGNATSASSQPGIYAAPESATAPISPADDVWSLGVTLVEAFTQRTPLLRGQTNVELPVPETIPAPYLEIARRCLQVDPSRRATLKEISTLLNPTSTASYRDTVQHADLHTPATQSPETLVAALEHYETPKTVPVAGSVAAVEPTKKSLASQQVSRLPHTLIPATPVGDTTTKPKPRKSRVAIPLAAVILVLAAILLAPRVLNRFSQLQPQAATVEPSIAPAPSSLTPPQTEKPVLPPLTQTKAEKRAAEKQAAREKNTAAARETVSSSDTVNPVSSRSVDATEARPATKSAKVAPPNPARGAVLYQVVPDISQRARDTIQGTVRVGVKVHVDASGNVTDAELDNFSSKFFGDQAVQVARRWTFTPPQVDGRNAPSEWLLRFEFTPKATKVFPAQTTP